MTGWPFRRPVDGADLAPVRLRPGRAAAELERSLPPHAALLRLARERRPPQEWYDSTDNPLRA